MEAQESTIKSIETTKQDMGAEIKNLTEAGINNNDGTYIKDLLPISENNSCDEGQNYQKPVENHAQRRKQRKPISLKHIMSEEFSQFNRLEQQTTSQDDNRVIPRYDGDVAEFKRDEEKERVNNEHRYEMEKPVGSILEYGDRTFSSFQAEQQEMLILQASRIYKGASFKSYDEFKKYFEAFKIVGNHPYRVSSSEILRDEYGNIDECYKYKYIVYNCAHYGKPRKRGNIRRANQHYLPSGCGARLRLHVDNARECLRITSFHNDHCNHENSEEDYKMVISKRRRIQSDTKPSSSNEKMERRIEEAKWEESSEAISVDPMLHEMLFTQALLHRQLAEYVVLNAYITECSRYLPHNLYLEFINSVYGGEFELSKWSDIHLRDVMVVVLQPPNVILRNLPPNLGLDELKEVRPALLHRIETAIRNEKLKRIDEMFSEIALHVLKALFRPDFPTVLQQFEIFATNFMQLIADENNL